MPNVSYGLAAIAMAVNNDVEIISIYFPIMNSFISSKYTRPHPNKKPQRSGAFYTNYGFEMK